ncbi:MAG: InlB B-repeat-containing protein, partial [Lentisphaerales bacterium]|nr:InlB B-repeat-containing protein [Lentisphaerales bacterium]
MKTFLNLLFAWGFILIGQSYALEISGQTYSNDVNIQTVESINISNSTFESTAVGQVISTSKINLTPETILKSGANLSFTIGNVTQFTINFVAGSHGSLTGETSQTVEFNGTATTVIAVPAPNYHFVSWSNGSTNNPLALTNVTEDQTITANFAIDQYSLTFNTDENGTISGSTSQTVDHGSSSTEVTAVANSGFIFKQWSDGSTQNPRIIQSVTSNLNLTAEFIVPPSSGNSYSEDFSSADSLNSWSVQSGGGSVEIVDGAVVIIDNSKKA